MIKNRRFDQAERSTEAKVIRLDAYRCDKATALYPKTEFGSGWYHDAAIETERLPQRTR